MLWRPHTCIVLWLCFKIPFMNSRLNTHYKIILKKQHLVVNKDTLRSKTCKNGIFSVFGFKFEETDIGWSSFHCKVENNILLMMWMLNFHQRHWPLGHIRRPTLFYLANHHFNCLVLIDFGGIQVLFYCAISCGMMKTEWSG